MNAPRRLVLVCNSHIDPVWLWPWQEGLAATLSTFRAAADLCERFESFVFCHNEAVLYRWVEEYEPALFARIRSLVQEDRWHIMGGWYLQPDCNIPSGESFVRQILAGPAVLPREVQRRAARRGEPRSLRPYPRARPDPEEERLRGVSLLPTRPRAPDAPSGRLRLGGIRRFASPRPPGHGSLQLVAGPGPRANGSLAPGAPRPPGRPAALGRREPRRRPVARGPHGSRSPDGRAGPGRDRPRDPGALLRGDGRPGGRAAGASQPI